MEINTNHVQVPLTVCLRRQVTSSVPCSASEPVHHSTPDLEFWDTYSGHLRAVTHMYTCRETSTFRVTNTKIVGRREEGLRRKETKEGKREKEQRRGGRGGRNSKREKACTHLNQPLFVSLCHFIVWLLLFGCHEFPSGGQLPGHGSNTQ